MACPICDRDADPKFRPFCSGRCADVDLARWLGDGYVIPEPEVDEEASESPADPPQQTRPQ